MSERSFNPMAGGYSASEPTKPTTERNAGEREGEGVLEPFVSATCRGERCGMCGEPAALKVGEEIPFDDPFPNRHNLTQYLCARHGQMVLQPYLTAAPVARGPDADEALFDFMERAEHLLAHLPEYLRHADNCTAPVKGYCSCGIDTFRREARALDKLVTAYAASRAPQQEPDGFRPGEAELRHLLGAALLRLSKYEDTFEFPPRAPQEGEGEPREPKALAPEQEGEHGE